MSNFVINPYSFSTTEEYCQSSSNTSQGFNSGRTGIGTHLGSGHVLAGKTISSVKLRLNYLGSASTAFQIKFYNASAGLIGTFASGNTSNLTSSFVEYDFSGDEDIPADGGYIGLFITGDDKMAVSYSSITNESDAILAYFGSTYSDTWEDQGENDSLRYCAEYSE
tara:strand:- start:136 stop:633 length:498 start_codon:yes stop_codon:yes gene_type:complete